MLKKPKKIVFHSLFTSPPRPAKKSEHLRFEKKKLKIKESIKNWIESTRGGGVGKEEEAKRKGGKKGLVKKQMSWREWERERELQHNVAMVDDVSGNVEALLRYTQAVCYDMRENTSNIHTSTRICNVVRTLT